MDSNSPQNNKSHRRKRKDPQSRDYSCKCGKSYLSYAAAYTHVKNKHQGDKTFLESIGKPERKSLKRGRPKERKLVSISQQASKLSILEQSILSIYLSFRQQNGDQKSNQSKVVLEGNQQVKIEDLVKNYDEIIEALGDPGINLFFDRAQYGDNGQLLCKFIEGINKHFLPNFAVKIIWMINYLIAKCSNLQKKDQDFFVDFDQMKNILSDEKIKLLWQQKKIISNFILVAFEKWVKATWDIQN